MVAEIKFFFWHSQVEKDVRIYNALLKHIQLSKWYKKVQVSSSGGIDPGNSVAKVLEKHLSSAQIIFPLISADFPWDEAEQYEQHWRLRSQNGNVKIISIQLRRSSSGLFKDFMSLPTNGIAIDSSPNQDEALSDIAHTLDLIIQEILNRYDQIYVSELRFTSALKGETDLERTLREKAELKNLYIEQIEEYELRHQYREIIEICEQMLSDCPEEAFFVHIRRGKAFEKLSDYENALASYENARYANVPQDEHVFIYIGDMLQRLKRYQEAVSHYQLASRIAPTDPTISQKLIEPLVALERFKEVLYECNRLVDRGQRDAWMYFYKGCAHEKLGELKQAILAYKQALLQEPHALKGYFALGEVHNALEESQQALEVYNAALRYYPEDSDLWRKKGSILRKLRSLDNAKDAYEQAVLFAPKNIYHRKEYAEILMELQSYKDAELQCSTIIKLEPLFAPAYSLRARVYEKLALQDRRRAEELERRERRNQS